MIKHVLRKHGDKWRCPICRTIGNLDSFDALACGSPRAEIMVDVKPCDYRRDYKTIAKGLLSCGCSEIRLHRCEFFGEVVAKNANAISGEVNELLQTIETDFHGRSCHNCPALLRPGHTPPRFFRTTELVADALRLADRLPRDLAGVAGVPRSGMLAASAIATRLHLPLWEITANDGLRAIGGGHRMRGVDRVGRLAIVEDSINSGRSLTAAARHARPGDVKAAVYVNPINRSSCDVAGVLLPMPHFFEWHFFGSDLVKQAAFDMDGVICEDCPGELDDDGARYAAWLRSVKPLWLPRPHPVGAIVTARLEKYRPQTVAWLERHGVKYRRLIMGAWRSKLERSQHYDAGQYKGGEFRKSNLRWFLESCPTQAKQIRESSGKMVICPTTGDVL